jgi:predicted transposase YdaD
MYDNVCKFLAEHFSNDFAQWLLGEPIAFTQVSPKELSLEPIRADALILLASEAMVLHIEFQTEPNAEIPFRMADYRLRVYRRYPKKRMYQVVIYLKGQFLGVGLSRHLSDSGNQASVQSDPTLGTTRGSILAMPRVIPARSFE